MTISPLVQAFLIHLAKLAGLSAAVAVIVALVQVAANFNVGSLPAEAQGFGVILVPLIVSALTAAEKQLELELSQEEAAKAQAQLATTKALLAKSEAKNLADNK